MLPLTSALAALGKRRGRLARFYLGNLDYLRAALFAYEAVITRECGECGLDPFDWNKGCGPTVKGLDQKFKNGLRPKERRDAHRDAEKPAQRLVPRQSATKRRSPRNHRQS